VTDSIREPNAVTYNFTQQSETQMSLQPKPDIALLWKRPDGTQCRFTRRGAELWVQVECDGQILHERLVSSPREALRTAAVWKRRVGAAKIASA